MEKGYKQPMYNNDNGGSKYSFRRYIGREEFEVFERNVTRSFDNVSTSIEHLSQKIDSITTRGTDWKSIFAGISVIVAVFVSIGGVISWSIMTKITANEQGVARYIDDTIALKETIAELKVMTSINDSRINQLIKIQDKILTILDTKN